MPHGRICYLEVPAARAGASAEFYSRLFGWTLRKRGDGAQAFDDSGGVSGSWIEPGPGAPQGAPRVYIMVDDLSKTLREIAAAGGRVVTPKTAIGPGGGAFAVFRDPAGTEFGLYEEPGR